MRVNQSLLVFILCLAGLALTATAKASAATKSAVPAKSTTKSAVPAKPAKIILSKTLPVKECARLLKQFTGTCRAKARFNMAAKHAAERKAALQKKCLDYKTDWFNGCGEPLCDRWISRRDRHCKAMEYSKSKTALSLHKRKCYRTKGRLAKWCAVRKWTSVKRMLGQRECLNCP